MMERGGNTKQQKCKHLVFMQGKGKYLTVNVIHYKKREVKYRGSTSKSAIDIDMASRASDWQESITSLYEAGRDRENKQKRKREEKRIK